jgi:hypothetical protein
MENVVGAVLIVVDVQGHLKAIRVLQCM